MTALRENPDYSYVAYIDESGDPGLNKVKPIDSNGSSEWLVVSAVVIRAELEHEVAKWVADMMSAINSHQMRDIHFSKLNPARKQLVCRYLAERKVRCFVVLSNKQNMKGYRNPWAEQIPSDNWFYCWMTRLLLERVTHFVNEKSQKEFGETRRIKLEFSERGGLSYSQMNAYYEWLRGKSRGGNLFLNQGDFAWASIHPNLLKVYNHTQRAGLKLADIVASAFFKGVDVWDTKKCDPEYAMLLKPRMATDTDLKDGLISGYGVKLMPKWRTLNVLPEQKELLTFYGYPKQWWQFND